MYNKVFIFIIRSIDTLIFLQLYHVCIIKQISFLKNKKSDSLGLRIK